MLKFLLIDDLHSALSSTQAAVREVYPDAQIFTAMSGQAGIALALDVTPDIILLDIVLPGMDGFEVCRRLKSEPQLQDTPVVFLSSSEQRREYRLLALDAGGEAYLTSPIDMTEFTILMRIMEKIRRSNLDRRADVDRLERLVEERTSELTDSQARFRTLIEQAGDALFIHGYDGRFTEVNRRACESLGYERDELMRLSVPDIDLEFDLEQAQAFWDTTEPDQPKTVYGTHLCKNGTTFPVEVRVGKCFINGEATFVTLARDISDRRRMEEDLRAAKDRAEVNDRLKSAFLMNMSHEIRTPLNGMLGCVDLLDLDEIRSEERAELIDIIRRSGARLLTTIEGILEISRIESGEISVTPAPLDLEDVYSFLYDFFLAQAQEKHLALRIARSGESCARQIVTDRHMFETIFINLIRNAIKFTREGEVEFGCRRNGHEACFFVRDTGEGIPADKLDAIFERFVQVDSESNRNRQHEGSGLGLTIVRSYVHALGGRLHVDSEPGRGSLFTFTIPSDGTGATHTPPKAAADARSAFDATA